MHKLHEDIKMCLFSLFNVESLLFEHRSQIVLVISSSSEWRSGNKRVRSKALAPRFTLTQLEIARTAMRPPGAHGPSDEVDPEQSSRALISYLCAVPVSRGNREVDLLHDRRKVILHPSLTVDLEFTGVQFRSGSTPWPLLGTPQIASQLWSPALMSPADWGGDGDFSWRECSVMFD